MDGKLDMSQQCALTAQDTAGFLGIQIQQVKSRGDLFLRFGETSPGMLHPHMESSVQEIHGPVGVHPEECHHDSLRDGTASLQGQAESWGCAAWRREGSREG